MRAAADVEGLAGPVSYASAWWAVGFGLLAAVLLWNLGVLWWGRPRRVPRAVAEPVDLEALRRRHLDRLADVEARARSGALDVREAVQEVSLVTRSWVHETSDVPARSLALEELRTAGPPVLAEAVAAMYPPEFAPAAPAAPDLDEALRRAREVVGATP